jgi:anti-sigma B factor antagonist
MSGAWFTYNGDHTVGVGGELDLASAPELAARLAGFESGDVTIDCSELTFLDSAGLNVLVRTSRRLTQAGGRLRLTGANEHVSGVLRITGLEAWLEA